MNEHSAASAEALLEYYETNCPDRYREFANAISPWILAKIKSSPLTAKWRLESWADDILQNVLLRVAIAPAHARWNPACGSLQGWLATCVRNACIDQLNVVWARPFTLLDPASEGGEGANVMVFREPIAAETDCPVERALANEYLPKLNRLIESYNRVDKQVILMAEYEPNTYEQLSCETGLAKATISRRVKGFRQKLTSILS